MLAKPHRIGAAVERDELEAASAHEEISVSEGVHGVGRAAIHVDLETNADDAQLLEKTVERIQDFEVGTIDVYLEEIDRVVADLCERLRHEDGLVAIGEFGIRPKTMLHPFLIRSRLQRLRVQLPRPRRTRPSEQIAGAIRLARRMDGKGMIGWNADEAGNVLDVGMRFFGLKPATF